MEDNFDHSNLEEIAEMGKQLLIDDGLMDATLVDLDNKVKRRKKNKRPIYIGALMLIFLIFFLVNKIFNNQNQPQHLYASNFDVLSTSLIPIERSSTTVEVDQNLIEAVNYYNEKDFTSAKIAFENYISSNENPNRFSYLYLAISMSTLGDHKQSNEILAGLNSQEINDIVDWYKALNYLQYDLNAAKNIFNAISKNANHYKNKEAMSIYQAL